MTYFVEDGRDEVVPELVIRFGGDDDENGGYRKLKRGPEECGPAEELGGGAAEDSPPGRRGSRLWCWVRLVLLVACLGVLTAVCIKWVGPFFMDKEIIPLINWETTTFSTPVLAVLVFASVAIFPSLLLPSSPSMWAAGMTFGYGFGFLLIISASAIGISLPYVIGSLFHRKIQGWLEKYPKKASILRSAGEGNWFHQFRAVALIRVSPFPYIIYNYCAVATDVKYGPYLLGSLVGMVPEIFVTIYTGILIRTLADASNEHHGLSAPQIIFTVLGFCAAAATTAFFTMYAKRKLKDLQKEDEVLLQ
ncbi:Transmembrane protein [Parasponia andersonii]|uniref:Transmembrane protein n=1 Tax=Parasponia andersonii TaxID=3476 RepID=A0A2P5C8X1_PARAD|nr:Transmembrane protein [Parasponia andersonii]